MWVQNWISFQHHDIAGRCLWSKSIKYPFLWVLMSHKIARHYVHNNSVHWDSITIVWLHLHGRLTGSFCSFSFQPHRPWKTWDYTAAVFFLDHSSFFLRERRLWEAQYAYRYHSVIEPSALQLTRRPWFAWEHIEGGNLSKEWAWVRLF